MPRPQSADLRERVLGACVRGEGSQEEIARRFQGVSGDGLRGWTSTPVFLGDLEQVLVPELKRRKPDAVIVTDNLRPHKAAIVGLLEATGFRLIYLPRYSPDLNPIEPGWSKLKTRLRAKAGRMLRLWAQMQWAAR